MFTLGKSAHKGKPVLIVDIESGSVAVSVVQIGGALACILYIERVYLPIENRSPEQLTSATISLLKDVSQRAIKKYAESGVGKKTGPIQSLHVLVGSPWVRSHTAVAEETFGEERMVTDKIIRDTAKRALDGSPLDAARILETSVTRVQLNGYSTGKPVGKRAHHIAVTSFQSDIDAAMKQGIEVSLQQLAPGRAVTIRSAMRAALAPLHERARSHHYLLIAMGATSTDCIAVHKEDANEHMVIPIGTATIAKRIAGDKGLAEETFSLMRMLLSDTSATPAYTALKTNLAIIEPELVKSFGDMFASLAAKRRIPNTCFLAAHSDFVPWLEHFFSRIDFAQFSVTAQPLSIESLTPQHLRTEVEWQSGVREDTGMAIAATFVNSMNN